jgi:hypothetical protein
MFVYLVSCSQVNERKFLVTKIRSAAKLATSEAVLTKVVSGKIDDKGIKSWFSYTNPNVIFKTEARVKYGVDLKKVKNEDVRLDGDSIFLLLPDVEILNFSYAHENFEELFSDFNSIKNPNKIEIIDDFFRQAELDIRKKIKLMGLENESEEKTRLFLEKFLSQYEFENIVIRFQNELEK